MLNGQKRQVDLLQDFYDAWLSFQQAAAQVKNCQADKEDLQVYAQDIVEAHQALQDYANRGKHG